MTEEAEHPTLTKEQIRFWIEKFKDGDITDIRYKQRLIDTFVNSVYLYDDKLVITYNVKDGARTVTLDEVNNSDLVQDGPPRRGKVRFAPTLFIAYGSKNVIRPLHY